MSLGRIDFIQLVVRHPGLLDRLDQTQVHLCPTSRAREGLLAVVDIVETREPRPPVPSTDIAAHPYLPLDLGDSAEGEGAIGPGQVRPLGEY